jgi:hypothetical protein
MDTPMPSHAHGLPRSASLSTKLLSAPGQTAQAEQEHVATGAPQVRLPSSGESEPQVGLVNSRSMGTCGRPVANSSALWQTL